jgi:hypothetical protein
MRIVGSILAIGLLAASWGCGKVTPFVDAAGDDDVQTIDATTAGTVTVTTMTRCAPCLNPGQPQRDVDVFVVSPTGEVGDSARTDASGNATLDVRTGDTVTALYLDQGDVDLVTFVAVAPGDHLTFGDEFTAGKPTPLGSMTVNWPSVLNATSYRVYYPCGQTGSDQLTTTIFEYTECHAQPMALGFVATDSAGTLIGSGDTSANFVANGTAALGSWELPVNMTVTATGIPDFVTQAEMDVVTLLNGQFAYSDYIQGAPSGGTFGTTFPFPTWNSELRGAAVFGRNGFGQQIRLDSMTAGATSYTGEQVGLPWLGEALASASAGQLTWITDGGGDYDLGVVNVSWNRSPPDGGQESYSWTLFIPPGVDQLTFPELPAALAGYAPNSGDFLSSPQVFYIDFAELDGYAAVRAEPEWRLADLNAHIQRGTVFKVSIGLQGGGNAQPAPSANLLTRWRAQ